MTDYPQNNENIEVQPNSNFQKLLCITSGIIGVTSLIYGKATNNSTSEVIGWSFLGGGLAYAIGAYAVSKVKCHVLQIGDLKNRLNRYIPGNKTQELSVDDRELLDLLRKPSEPKCTLKHKSPGKIISLLEREEPMEYKEKLEKLVE